MSRHHGLGVELHAAGFSTRTVNALVYSLGLSSLEQLRTAEWGSVEDRTGLAWALQTLPNMGRKGLAEVVAFRAGLDPKAARPAGKRYYSVPLDDAEFAALDAWIAAQPKPVGRPEAIRAMVVASLHLMGEK